MTEANSQRRDEEQLGMFTEVSSDLLEQMGEAADDNRCWPKTLAELVDVINQHFQHELQLSAEKSRQQARNLVLLFARQFGGQPFYIPKGRSLQKGLRDRQIWDEFTGNNVKELSDRHSLTAVQIYEIIKTQRAIEQKKVQRDMFG